MTENERNQVGLLYTITERGAGKTLIEELKKHQILCHFQMTGRGTATTEMMDILGLGSTDKDIVVSLATRSAIEYMMGDLYDNMKRLGKRKGVMMYLSLGAVSNLVEKILFHATGPIPEEGETSEMKNEYKHSLIVAVVNQGFVEPVMQLARKAGATGGTVIKARIAEREMMERFVGKELDEEREIITILAPDSSRDKIIESIYGTYGFNSKAQTVLLSLPVNKALKI